MCADFICYCMRPLAASVCGLQLLASGGGVCWASVSTTDADAVFRGRWCHTDAVCMLYQTGAASSLLRRYCGSNQALLRLYKGSMKTL